MQFKALLVSIFAASALAAPAADPAGTLSTRASTWTIENFKRVCNSADTTCTYTFYINTASSSSVSCKYVHNGKPASKTSGGPAHCGDFAVTSGWDGATFPGHGFTTLAVVNSKAGLRAFPSYADTELAGGKVVKPNKAFAPQAF